MGQKPPIFVFKLQGSEYGIEAERVSEVKEGIPITPLPFSSEAIVGIGNLRGEIIPIIDLGKILHGKVTDSNLFLILERRGEKVGVKVDEVEKIEYPREYEVTKQKRMVEDMLGKYIKKVIMLKDKRIISILDVDKILEDLEGE